MLIKMGKKSSKVLPRGADSANLYIIEEGCQSYLRPISYLAPNLASSLTTYTHFTVNCPATASSSTVFFLVVFLDLFLNELLARIADFGLRSVDCINVCSTCWALQSSILNNLAYKKATKSGPYILNWASNAAPGSNGPSTAAKKYLRQGGGLRPFWYLYSPRTSECKEYIIEVAGEANSTLLAVMQRRSNWEKTSWLRLFLDNSTPKNRRAVDWDFLMHAACNIPIGCVTFEIIKLLLRGGASANGLIGSLRPPGIGERYEGILDVRWLPLGCLIHQLSSSHKDRLPSGFNEAASCLVPRGTVVTSTWTLHRDCQRVGRGEYVSSPPITGDLGYLLLAQYREMALPFWESATEGWQERERPELCELPRKLFVRNLNRAFHQGSGSETALMVACDMATRGIVDILLDAKVARNTEDEHGRTALMRTVDPGIVGALLEKGAALQSSWKYGTILHYYISLRLDPMYRDDRQFRGWFAHTELPPFRDKRLPPSKGQLLEVLTTIMAHGGKDLVNQKSSRGIPPLQLALMTTDSPDIDLLRLLLDAGADVNATFITRGPTGKRTASSALKFASHWPEVVAALWKAGAKPHLRSKRRS